MRVKMNRQMVFVTHNPNIPVLAEAEKILVMESDGCAGHIRKTGSVDDCKENIVNILEGGEEAFKKRKLRYAY
jgi:ABC-type sulfate/molybdate transport systems ATPase subunit